MNKKEVRQQRKTGVSKKSKSVSMSLEEAEAARPTLQGSMIDTATRIDLEYVFGSSYHCFWAIVKNSAVACHKWLNDEQVKTIAHAAFMAEQVIIQYDKSTGEIQRIRPVKTL